MGSHMKKTSKNLVAIGTHVPLTTKMTIQAIAESQNKSVYEVLQEAILKLEQEYNQELEKLNKKEEKKSAVKKTDDSDLLG